MTLARFHELAEQFCAAAGSPVPELAPDRDGWISFSVVVRDVHVAVACDPVAHSGQVFVYATFGPVPPQRELEVCRALLYANLLMLRVGSPVFMRNPGDGQVILRYARDPQALTGDVLWSGVHPLVDRALQWREDCLLSSAAPHSLNAHSTSLANVLHIFP